MNHPKVHPFVAALVLAAGLTGGALAQPASALSDEQVRERLDFLQNALHSGQPRAKLWWYGWIAGYSGAAVAQGVLAAANWKDDKEDNEFAQDMLVGGATCALGSAGLLISPFVPATGPGSLKRMPEETPEERRAKLVRAEELMRECAEREKKGRGWLTHGLNLGVNVAAGLVTVLAFDRPWSDGLLTFAINETVSLLNIFSQPRRAQRDLKNYEVRYQGKPGAYREAEASASWFFAVGPGLVTIGLRF
jgi:hypothetical protein